MVDFAITTVVEPADARACSDHNRIANNANPQSQQLSGQFFGISSCK